MSIAIQLATQLGGYLDAKLDNAIVGVLEEELGEGVDVRQLVGRVEWVQIAGSRLKTLTLDGVPLLEVGPPEIHFEEKPWGTSAVAKIHIRRLT